MRPIPGSNIHGLITDINNQQIERKKSLADQIDFFSSKCDDDDRAIISKVNESKIHRNYDRDNQYKRRRYGNSDRRDNNNNGDNGNTSNALLNQEQDDNVLLSMQDLASLDIPNDKITELLNKGKQAKAIDNKSNNPTNPTPFGGPRANVPRPFILKQNNNNNYGGNNNGGGFSRVVSSTNRGSYPRGNQSFFNHDDEHYHNFTTEEYIDVPDNALSTIDARPNKRRRIQDLPKSCDVRAWVLDNGNNSSHMIVNKEMLPEGPIQFQDGARPKVSGQDKKWTITHSQYGYHHLLGKCIFNPEGRVNLVNQELLTHDGWSLQVYSDEYGEFAYIYNRTFNNGKTYTLEFIRNVEGHLVTFDPSIDNGFEPPSSEESKSLGDINSLRSFMANKQSERLELYYKRKHQSNNSYYQEDTEDYNLENDEEGRHRY
jgi:hypothetical protein